MTNRSCPNCSSPLNPYGECDPCRNEINRNAGTGENGEYLHPDHSSTVPQSIKGYRVIRPFEGEEEFMRTKGMVPRGPSCVGGPNRVFMTPTPHSALTSGASGPSYPYNLYEMDLTGITWDTNQSTRQAIFRPNRCD